MMHQSVKMMFSQGSAIAAATSDTNHYIAEIASSKKIGATAMLHRQTLIDVMTKHYHFPDEHRVIIWRYLFRLPMNKSVYALLASQPVHQSVRRLPDSLPIRYSVVLNRLVRLLSALAYWHPPLADCDWLPALVFPFLRLFERDSLVLFEFIVTVICNWCEEWLHFIPNPPITILARIDRIARAHGGEAPLSVAWPALRSFFGEVATTEAALALFDNILSARPVYLEYLVASFALIQHEKVINERNVRAIIGRARRMFAADSDQNPNKSSFLPLPSGFYPVMPVVKRIPQWREGEVQRIRTEAEASRQQEIFNEEIEAECAKIERQRRTWMVQRSLLREIEEEQMEEFRRREQEIQRRENMKEEVSLQLRRERLRARRLEEEQAIEDWRRDCGRVQDEMMQVSATRRATWANWLSMKEDSANIANEEVRLELELVRNRDATHRQEMERYHSAMAKAAQEEQQALNLAVAQSRELEQEKYELRQKLNEARRPQAAAFGYGSIGRLKQ